MRTFDTATTNALQARVVKLRNFLWITAPRISDRVVASIGFWNDRDNITANYIDVDDGTTKSRAYTGSGSLIEIGNIPMVSDITIRTVAIKANGLTQEVIDYVRGYDLHMAPIEVHRGYFVPGTYTLVAPAVPRFVGFIDKPEIITPAQGQSGQITLNCVSHTRMLTRINPEVRSNASQHVRNASDNFYQDAPTAGQWTIFWGQQKAAIQPLTLQSLQSGVYTNSVNE